MNGQRADTSGQPPDSDGAWTGNGSGCLRSGQAGLPRKGDDIAERLLDLGAGVITLLPALASQPGGLAVAKQLERCGPAGGANYEEARGSESYADFVHKVRLALKEVRETRCWLALIARARLLDPKCVSGLIDEAGQLIAILTASSATARRRAEQRP